MIVTSNVQSDMLESQDVEYDKGLDPNVKRDSASNSTALSGTCLLNLPKGIIGFSDFTQWQFEVLEEGPLHLLAALPNKDINFYLVNPYLVRSDYSLDISNEDFEALGKPDEKNIAVFVILTLKDEAEPTCNLLGPVLINTKSKVAYQCINNIGNWGTKHAISNGEKQST